MEPANPISSTGLTIVSNKVEVQRPSGNGRVQIISDSHVESRLPSGFEDAGIFATADLNRGYKSCRVIKPDLSLLHEVSGKPSEPAKQPEWIDSLIKFDTRDDGAIIPSREPDFLRHLAEACQERECINKGEPWLFHHPPIHMAIRGGQYKLAALAITNGADVNLTCYTGQAPLHLLAERGDMELLNQFLSVVDHMKMDIDMETKDSDGKTPLMIATIREHHQYALSLISYGASINALDNHGQNVLSFAILSRSSNTEKDELTELMSTLISEMNIESLSSHDERGQTVMHLAAENNEFEVVEGLIDREINVNVRSESGSLPLMLAVKEDAWHSVVMLVDAGSEGINDLLDLDNDELTPLTKAVLKGERDTLEAMAASRHLDLDKDIGKGKTHRQLLDECCKELSERRGKLEQQSLTAKEVYSILGINESE